MRSLSNVGLGLSLVFGCLLLALIAELYYLLWWKRKRFPSNTEIEDEIRSPASATARAFLHTFCWKKPSSLSSTSLNPQGFRVSNSHVSNDPEAAHHQLHAHPNKDQWLLKPLGDQDVEAELMALSHLSGPPRFLFPIKEETKEDLESEDGKSRNGKSRKGSSGRSLSDLVGTLDTPFLTPLASPPYFTPPLTPMDSFHSHGFNPLFETGFGPSDMNFLRSSPPPKFKFLKDAEEKLLRRKLEADAGRGVELEAAPSTPKPNLTTNEKEGSFMKLLVADNKERIYHSSSSQVLPLAASPSSTLRTSTKKEPILH